MLKLDDLRSGQCPLCRQPAHCKFDSVLLIQHGVVTTPISVTCDRCGHFSITWEATLEVERLKAGITMSGIAREWTEFGRELEINQDNLPSLINLAPRTLKEKRQRLLQTFVRICPQFEREHVFRTDRDYPLAHVDINEFMFVLRYIRDEKLAEWGKNNNNELGIRLTAKGWEEVDAIEKPTALREKAFVAMWFNSQVQPAFHGGIAPAISETGYRPIRIDLQEHSDSVIDRIFAEIQEARFVVADFTGHRGGVYFEAGFARGLGLNVIWTCKDDHMDQLHFDVRGFNVIVWNSPADLRERLNARIRAVVGHGPLYDSKAID